MNNWKNFTVNIGTVKPNSTVPINFESTRPLQIQHVSPGCAGCTKFLDYKDNILSIRYDAPEFPKHLTEKQTVINKTLTVYYEDNTSDTLKFVGILNNK